MESSKVYTVFEVLASAARAATDNGSAARLPQVPRGMVFTLDVTAAGTLVGDTLDVKIQTKLDGTNWEDVCHFTQVAGNGGAKRFYFNIYGGVSYFLGGAAEFAGGEALGPGNFRSIFGDEWRAVWTVVNGGGTHSFTFAVKALAY